jgi:hypothetical protein
MQAQLLRDRQLQLGTAPKPDAPWYAKVVDNPIMRGLNTALQPLQMPGRAILTGIEHLGRASDNPLLDFIDDEASLADDRSVWDRIQGKGGYGAGQIIDSTGNEWADRAIGFAGDVATDPTTYLTFGATAAAGRGARTATAAKAAMQGLGDDVVSRAAKGAAFLTDQERVLLGLDKAGVRFAGKRIPGTAGVSNAVGQTLGTARRAVTTSRPWQTIARNPEYLKQAGRVLETGVAEGAMTPTAAASLFAWDEAYRAISKTVSGPAQHQAKEILMKLDENARRELTHAMERGEAAALRPLLDDLLGKARDAGVHVGDIENYMPHFWTDQARAVLADRPILDASGKHVTVDLTKESGVTLERSLRGGEYTIGGKTVDLGDGSIDSINKALNKAFPDAGVERWLEDDSAKLISGYIAAISSDIGEVGAFKRLLSSRAGVAGALDDVSDEVIDKVASRVANKEMKDALGKTLKARREAYKVEQGQARETAEKLQAEITNWAKSETDRLGDLGKRMRAHLDAAAARGRSLADESENLGKMIVQARAQATDRLRAIRAQLAELDDKIAAAKVEAATLGTKESRLGRLNAYSQKRMELQDAAAEQQRLIAEAQSAAERMARMKQLSDSILEQVEDPDAMRAMAQSLVETKLVPEYSVENAMGVADVTEFNERAVQEFVERSQTAAADSVNGVAARISAIDEFVDAMESQVPILRERLAVNAKAVNAARAERVGASPLNPNYARTEADIAQGAGAGFEKAQLRADLDVLDTRRRVLRSLDVKRDDLDEAMQDFSRIEALRKSVDDVPESLAQLRRTQGAIETQRGAVARAKQGQADVAKLGDASVAARRQMQRAFEEQISTAEAEIWQLLDDQFQAATALGKARRSAATDRQAVDAAGAAAKAVQGKRSALEEAQELADALDSDFANAIAQLPPAEQAYFETLRELGETRRSILAAKEDRTTFEALLRRAERLNTPEAHARAAKEAERYVAQRPTIHYRTRVTKTEKVKPAYELPLRAELEAKLADIPSTSAINLRGDASKVARTRSTLPPSAVSDEMLAALPEAEANAFRSVRDEFNRLREGGIGEQGLRRQNINEVERQLNTMTDFVGRYNAAVAKGAAPGDELAAKIGREVMQSRFEAARIERKRLADAIASGGDDAAARAEFDAAIDDISDRWTDLSNRRDALQNELRRKVGGTDHAGRDAINRRRLTDDLGDDVSALQGRTVVRALINETKEAQRLERELIELELKTILGKWGTNDVRLGHRAGAELAQRAEGDINIGAQLVDSGALGRDGGMDSVLDAIKVKGEGKRATAYIKGPRKQFVDELYGSLNDEARARLAVSAQTRLAALDKELAHLGAAKRGLGSGADEVTSDWRNVIFGQGEAGTLQSRRAGLEEQLGLYDTVEGGQKATAASLRAAADEEGNVARAATQRAQGLGDPQAELDALPTASEAVSGPQRAAEAGVRSMETQRTVLQTELERVARGRDKAFADELDKVNSARAAEATYEALLRDGADAVKADFDRVKDLGRRAAELSASKDDINKTFDQLDKLVKELPNSPELAGAVALHKEFAEQVAKLGKADEHIDYFKQLRELAKDGKGTEVYGLVAHDGWQRVAEKLMRPEDQIAVREPIARALRNFKDLEQKGELWKTVEKMTQFFKTYATATPGFQVRNAMSGVFMNATEGVGFADHGRAFSAWRKYMDDPMNYLNGIRTSDPQLYDAFMATFGSGAGGNFSAAELGSEAGTKLMHNAWTKASRKLGENVEGPVRLALALKATREGADVYEALARVTRIHFDYSNVSKLDRNIKLLIPFWTFMSRNLPLQIQQMFMRPRLYSTWRHFVENFGGGMPDMPAWLQARDAMPVGSENEDGDQWAVAPDLPFLNLGEDVASLDPRDPLKALSNLNPMFTAPLEAARGERFRFNMPLEGAERWTYPLQQMLPPIAQGQRLLGLGRYDGQADEKIAQFFGLPVQKITEEERAAERRRQAGG